MSALCLKQVRGREVSIACDLRLREFVDAGGFMALGPSYSDLYRRAATYVDKILAGAKPADLPVEQPAKFEMIVILKAAKVLGFDLPALLLARADEVIE